MNGPISLRELDEYTASLFEDAESVERVGREEVTPSWCLTDFAVEDWLDEI
jgi:hypothetical protein